MTAAYDPPANAVDFAARLREATDALQKDVGDRTVGEYLAAFYGEQVQYVIAQQEGRA